MRKECVEGLAGVRGFDTRAPGRAVAKAEPRAAHDSPNEFQRVPAQAALATKETMDGELFETNNCKVLMALNDIFNSVWLEI